MAKKRKKNKDFDLDPYKVPSSLMIEIHLRSGAGVHSESKEASNKRTGRLRGVEKLRIISGDYES